MGKNCRFVVVVAFFVVVVVKVVVVFLVVVLNVVVVVVVVVVTMVVVFVVLIFPTTSISPRSIDFGSGLNFNWFKFEMYLIGVKMISSLDGSSFDGSLLDGSLLNGSSADRLFIVPNSSSLLFGTTTVFTTSGFPTVVANVVMTLVAVVVNMRVGGA